MNTRQDQASEVQVSMQAEVSQCHLLAKRRGTRDVSCGEKLTLILLSQRRKS